MNFSSKNKYNSKFDDFMSQTKTTAEEEQQRMKEAERDQQEMERKAETESKRAKEKLEETKETFKDFSNTKQQEEMSVKDVFKNINFKEHLDEASNMFSSIKSGASKKVGGILEKRKQLFAKAKSEAVEEKVKEELDKSAQKDSAKEEKTDEASEKADEATDKATEETPEKEEAAKEPKESVVSKLKTRVGSTTEKINEKAPFLYKTGVFMKDLWQETFPNDDGKVKSRMRKRKEIAQIQKKYSEEEIEAMQEEIPDWKRTAVTMVDESQQEEQKSGYIKKLFKKVGSKVSDSSVGKKVFQSEEYKELMKKYKDIKVETEEFKEDFKDEVETTQNPVVGGIRGISDKFLSETPQSQAVAKMRMFDPEFDILELNYEVEEIFEDMFNSFLEGDLEYLQKFCGEACLAIIKADKQRREKEFWEYKYKELIFCTDTNLVDANIGEDNRPRFSFTFTTQDINCKVSTKNPEEIVEGGDSELQQ